MSYSNDDYGVREGEIADNIARLHEDVEALGDMPNIPREMKNRLQSLQDQLADLYDTVADDAARSVIAVEEVLIARPWTSAFVAFGMGCLFGALLRPRRSSW